MTIIDLSHSISENMPVYPGTEPPVIRIGCSISEDGFLEREISMFSHTGTHMDAPAHLLEEGATLDRFPVAQFFGKAFILRCDDGQGPEIKLQQLLAHEKSLKQVDFLLLQTGWSHYWGEGKYFSGYPVLSQEAAEFLGDLPLKGIGVDTISVDGIDSVLFPVHMALLKKNIVLIENLTNLQAVPGAFCTFACFPLKFVSADGSPVRAVAVLEDSRD